MSSLGERNPGAIDYLQFFLPLALQSVAQSLTHPLVAVVAAQGAGGVLNVAGMAQSTSISFLLQTFNMGLVTTGMLFAKTRKGFEAVSRLNLIFVLCIAAIHGFFTLPGPAHFLFGVLIGLPPGIEAPATIGFLAGLPLSVLFMFRTRYYIILFSRRASGKSSIASVLRVLLTIALAPLFVRLGLVGPVWAYVCLSIPVALETILLRAFSVGYIRALPDTSAAPPSLAKLFVFSFPLSLSSTLMVAASTVLAAFIARSPQPELVLPVYYLLTGVVNPLSAAMSSMQRVVLAFAPGSIRKGSSFRFALSIGVAAGLLPLVFMVPPLTRAYFIELQNMSPSMLPLLRLMAVLFVPHPFLVGLRSQIEGTASYLRKSRYILASYGGYLLAIGVVGTLGLRLGVPGCLIGPGGLMAANLSAMGITIFLLKKTVPDFALIRPRWPKASTPPSATLPSATLPPAN